MLIVTQTLEIYLSITLFKGLISYEIYPGLIEYLKILASLH